MHIEVEEKTFLNMDTVVPLGIIVNELVSNALRHAFPDKGEGMVKIRLYREEKGDFKGNRVDYAGIENTGIESTMVVNAKKDASDTVFILTISDNGVGMHESINIENPSTLGLQLVTILVDQLEGEIELKRDFGTEFIIKIAVNEKKEKFVLGKLVYPDFDG